MGYEELFEVKNMIKFAFLFIPLTIFIFMFAPTLKWKLLLTFGGLVGVVTALSGGTIGKSHGFRGRR